MKTIDKIDTYLNEFSFSKKFKKGKEIAVYSDGKGNFAHIFKKSRHKYYIDAEQYSFEADSLEDLKLKLKQHKFTEKERGDIMRINETVGKYLNGDSKAVQIINFIQGQLISGDEVTREEMYMRTTGSIDGVSKDIFYNVWTGLIANELLIKVSNNTYMWNI